MARFWADRCKHPLADCLFGIAIGMIDGTPASEESAIAHMNEIANFPHLYMALAIAYFSCADPDEEVEENYDKITEAWKGQARQHG